MKEKTDYEKALSIRAAQAQAKAIMQEPESKGKHINSTMTMEEMQNVKFYAADSPEAKAIIAAHDKSKAAQKAEEDAKKQARVADMNAREAEDNTKKAAIMQARAQGKGEETVD